MAYVFRIHDAQQGNPNATAPVAAAQVQDWSATGYIQGNLIQNIEISNNPRKMGTSIPSFFSRIFLFEGAFSSLGNNIGSHTGMTPNTKIVSECFDMLEFIFQNGQNKKLKVRHWSSINQIATLNNDGANEHRKLAHFLQDEILKYPELSDIYLFYWTDISTQTQNAVEHLIGGTSPYTLVFTSPNWKRHMAESGWHFNRLDGSPLFDNNNYKSLSQRAPAFKDMVYGIYNAYSLSLSVKATYLRKYIALEWDNETIKNPAIVGMANNTNAFENKYSTVIASDNTQVNVLNVPIAFEKVIMHANSSDYSIVCTSNRYADYVYKGNNQHIDRPLVLNDAGILNANYIGTTKWDPTTCKIKGASIKDKPLHLRQLPGGMSVTYPYVVASDFLEDTIIKVPYTIDSRNFMTLYDGQSQYLLPLKSYFFDFFNIKDLERIVDNQGNKMLSVKKQDEDSVEVILRVPVEHKHPASLYNSTIELKRIYTGSSIIKTNKCQLNIGIFPFYKVIDIPDVQQANQHNKYVVALASRNGVSLIFKNIVTQNVLQSVASPRSTEGTIVLGSTYYDVNDTFDIISVNIGGGAVGLVIPKWKELNAAQIVGNMDFSIDFGTSNTYIAIKKGHQNSESFSINIADAQVVYLKDPNYACNNNSIVSSQEILRREFIPETMGMVSSVCSFPMRTATCELNNFEALQPKLFGNISVGYYFQNESFLGVGNFSYKSDLKWALEKNPANTHYKNRVCNYYKGLLWIIKNKCLIEGYGLPNKIYVTFPQAMVVPTRNVLRACWQNAFNELNLDWNSYVEDNEAVAPYHAMATTVMGSSHMNIDIGGGTSDILYVVKNGGQIVQSLFTSTKFAADDLWGDGVNIVQAGNPTAKDNGFRTYMDGIIAQIAPTLNKELLDKYNSICSFAINSSDIMGFLFNNDNAFDVKTNITGQANLYSLIFIHYAATLYNVARILKKEELPIPEKLTFTGMGSKYTNMISINDSDLKTLTRILLEVFTGQSAPLNFSVIRLPNSKEVTAQGALIGPTLAPAYKVNGQNLELVEDYGFDTDTEITYNQVSNDNIKNNVIGEYEKFISLLKENDRIKSYLFQTFNLRIKEALLDDLLAKGTSSYQNICGTMVQYGQLPLNETLFFWPLKHSLYEVSKKYQMY